MELKALNKTTTDWLNLFAGFTGGIDELTTAIKDYIGSEGSKISKELEQKIKNGDEEVKKLLGVNLDKFKAFALLIDKWDGVEDGEFNPQQTLLDLSGLIGKNAEAIGINADDIVKLNALLAKERDERIKGDNDLSGAIEKAKQLAKDLISNMEKTITSLADRMSLAENKVNEVVDSINTLADGIGSSIDEFKKSIAKFQTVKADNSNAV